MSTVTRRHGGTYRISPGDLTLTYCPDIIVEVQIATLEEHDLRRSEGIALAGNYDSTISLDTCAGTCLLQGDEPLFDVDADA